VLEPQVLSSFRTLQILCNFHLPSTPLL
jgi:hypothetical protein